MPRNEKAIESEIQAKGLTAPRITPQHISDQIVAMVSGRASVLFKDAPAHPSLECLTICIITLRNGFTLVGTSACASPENYDENIGHEIAYKNAREQIWALEHYLLRSKLAGQVS